MVIAIYNRAVGSFFVVGGGGGRAEWKFGPKYKWFKISYLKLVFYKKLFGHTNFYIRQHGSVDIIRVYFLISDFLAESLKASKNYQKRSLISLKKTSLIIWTSTSLIIWTSTHSLYEPQLHSLYEPQLTHYINLNSLIIWTSTHSLYEPQLHSLYEPQLHSLYEPQLTWNWK